MCILLQERRRRRFGLSEGGAQALEHGIVKNVIDKMLRAGILKLRTG